jgi:hypothetical protein
MIPAMRNSLLVIYAVVLMVLSLGGCSSKPAIKPLFKDAAIQDSLRCFLERIDSVPNHYNAPSLYAVRFNLMDQDSLIRFGAYTGLWLCADVEVDTTGLYDIDPFGLYDDLSAAQDEEPGEAFVITDTRTPNWIGLYRYGKKYVLVESDWDPLEVINMSSLGPWEEFESLYHDTTPYDDCSFYHEHCEKTYLFKSPDSLRLISRRIGRPDPDFKDWPQTIDY